jgi:2-dehydro-3-deoxygalactonokinase
MRRLIAVDWGTSSLRGARLAHNGSVIEERSFARGILGIAEGGFRAALDEAFGDWLSGHGALCLISGMAGSKQGWVEAPYCECPAGLRDVAARLTWVEPDRIAIVPGLSCEHGDVPDVMRGEETQVFGAMKLLGVGDGLFVLPGTHSKWVQVSGGRIRDFATLMTGEFYALLRRHSILSRTLPADEGVFDPDAFDRGLACASASAGLLQAAFSVRTLSLFERLASLARLSYLSGIVIGEELRSRSLDGVQRVVVIGSDALTLRYERALSQRGIAVATVGSQAAWQGLHEMARTIDT